MIQTSSPRTFGFAASVVLVGAALLAACTTAKVSQVEVAKPDADTQHLTLETPVAWGGQARCDAGNCRAALVEHRASEVVVWQLDGRGATLLAQHETAYHPDSAVWLDENHVVAAVEHTLGLDIFELRDNGLVLVRQIEVDFPPRDVLILDDAESGEADPRQPRMLVTPYSGRTVAWVEWNRDTDKVQVQKGSWCAAPWHPVAVPYAPGQAKAGLAVGCLDDNRVIWVAQDSSTAKPVELADFDAVPRQVAPAPSGRWLYVALETGDRNARIDMTSGNVQYLQGWPSGAVAAAPLADDLVIWGDDQRLHLQRIADDGSILETRWLKTSGFSTSLQLIDLDGDGELDILVLNSAGETSEIIYGPLWEIASDEEPEYSPAPSS